MLRRFIAPELVFGRAARKQLASFVSAYQSKKVLVVTDPGVMAAGWAREAGETLSAAGIPYCIFDGVSPNPRAVEVALGTELYLDQGCDMVVAVGGGSPMDCAKGIAVSAVSGKSVLSFEGLDRVNAIMPPLVCIPSTAGTSADVSRFAIINHQEQRYKFAIISNAMVPRASLIDPELTTSMGSYLTACTGIDAMVHAIEAFVSTGAGPLTDSYALEAMDLINRYLPALVSGSGDNQARDRVMEGSLKAGLAFSNAMLGAVHAMAHSLGGYLDLPHGECNAMLLDHVVAYNYPMAPEKYTRIALQLGIPVNGMNSSEVRESLLSYLRNFKKSLGIDHGLRKAGVGLDDIKTLSAKAIADPCLLTNPRPARESDIATIYREAL